MTKPEMLNLLAVCQNVLLEAQQRAGDVNDETYNPDYQVELKLTIRELRVLKQAAQEFAKFVKTVVTFNPD